jgi:hypothetical protein
MRLLTRSGADADRVTHMTSAHLIDEPCADRKTPQGGQRLFAQCGSLQHVNIRYRVLARRVGPAVTFRIICRNSTALIDVARLPGYPGIVASGALGTGMGWGVPGSAASNPAFSLQDGASGEQLLTDVGEAERLRALERFQILRPCLENGVPLAIWRTDPMAAVRADQPTLLIVDEVDRLKTAGLEQLRDFYDRRQVGMVFIG